jgi:speckle-type POZ protein
MSSLNNFDINVLDEKFDDLCIKVGNEKIFFPKTLLIENSPVFKAMFNYNTRGNVENFLEISDTEPEVIKEMLRFIYFRKVENLDQLSIKLLIVANK